MPFNQAMLSNNSNEWATPQYMFDMLNETWKFTLDVCACAANAKCEKFYSIEDDGLAQVWHGSCFMNPPYGREVKKWIRKAYEESRRLDVTVVCLIAARPDTAYWHDYIMKADHIYFIRGRLQFSRPGYERPYPAPFPSAVVVFTGMGTSGHPTISTMEKPNSRKGDE